MLPDARGVAQQKGVHLCHVFQVFVLDRLIEDDGIRGDEYGDFDKNTVAEERARLKREKVTPGIACNPQLQHPRRPSVQLCMPLAITLGSSCCTAIAAQRVQTKSVLLEAVAIGCGVGMAMR